MILHPNHASTLVLLVLVIKGTVLFKEKRNNYAFKKKCLEVRNLVKILLSPKDREVSQ